MSDERNLVTYRFFGPGAEEKLNKLLLNESKKNLTNNYPPQTFKVIPAVKSDNPEPKADITSTKDNSNQLKPESYNIGKKISQIIEGLTSIFKPSPTIRITTGKLSINDDTEPHENTPLLTKD